MTAPMNARAAKMSPSSPTLRASKSPSMARSGGVRSPIATRSRHPSKFGAQWGFAKSPGSPLVLRPAPASPLGARAAKPAPATAKAPTAKAPSAKGAVPSGDSHPSLDGWTIYHDSLRGNMKDWTLALEAAEQRLAAEEEPAWMADNLGRWWSHHVQAVHHHHTMAQRCALPPRVVEDQTQLLANMGRVSEAVAELLRAAGFIEVTDPTGPQACLEEGSQSLLAYTSSPIALAGKLFATVGGSSPRGGADAPAMRRALGAARAAQQVALRETELRFAEAQADGLPLFASHFTKADADFATKLSVWDIVSLGPYDLGLFLRSMSRSKQLKWAAAEGIPLPIFKCLLLPKARQYDTMITQLLMDLTPAVRPSDFDGDKGCF